MIPALSIGLNWLSIVIVSVASGLAMIVLMRHHSLLSASRLSSARSSTSFWSGSEASAISHVVHWPGV